MHNLRRREERGEHRPIAEEGARVQANEVMSDLHCARRASVLQRTQKLARQLQAAQAAKAALPMKLQAHRRSEQRSPRVPTTSVSSSPGLSTADVAVQQRRALRAVELAEAGLLLSPLSGAQAAVAEAAAHKGAPRPIRGSKEEQERQQEEQLNALRVLYAAQHAVKHANESCGTAPCGLDPKPKFDELMKNITFPKAGLLAGDAPARKW